MFRDGLGERRHVNAAGNDATEVLCLRTELTSIPSFEFALRERVSHLAQFRHACYGRVRSVERLNDGHSTLALTSDHTPGVRLSDLLAIAEREQLPLDINAALCLIRQLVPAVAMLHQAAPQVSHGAIAPERIIVTPHARVVLVEYVLGAALEQLRFSQERYWKELRVATARVGGLPRFDHRTDVTAVGIVALSLILGRPLRADEFPGRLPEALGSAWAISARGGLEPLPPGLRSWIGRALQLDARNSFTTSAEALAELDRVLGDSDYLAAPAALQTVLANYQRLVGSSDEVETPVPVDKIDIPLPAAVNEARVSVSAVPASQPGAAAPATSAIKPAAPINAPIAPVPPLSPAPPAASVADPGVVKTGRIEPIAPAQKNIEHEPVLILSPKQPEPAIDDTDEVLDEETPSAPRPWTRWAVAAVLAIAVVALGGFAAIKYVVRGAETKVGTVLVTTNPAGAQLLIDGVLRGTTPASLTVPPGSHVLVIRGEGDPRTIPITVTAGAQISHYIDLPKAAAAAGQLQVRSEPSGAQVTIDGVPRGASPVTINDLTPGDHTVSVESDLGKVEQKVSVEAGAMSSLMVPLSAPRGAPVSGWISLSAPAELQILENGKLLGTSKTDRLMVSAGSHQLELVNDAIGYHATKTVQVVPGKVSPLKIDLPKGTLALNAIPWADVWIDGEKVGETPLGNLQVTVGSHDVVFRNPDLGEQTHTVVVSLTAPARLSVDLRKK